VKGAALPKIERADSRTRDRERIEGPREIARPSAGDESRESRALEGFHAGHDDGKKTRAAMRTREAAA
jgi:hypothetical protein|tara:strand:- start:10195 stop:10398 length:204 start_codon:yes stop_codon:yes gene_type:complete